MNIVVLIGLVCWAIIGGYLLGATGWFRPSDGGSSQAERWGRRLLLGWLLGGLIWCIPLQPVWAAEEATDAPTSSTAAPSTELNATDIPSEKVNQFVSAYLQVVDLIDARSEALQRAETEAESRRLQQSIQAEAFERIAEAGLTRQEYLQLLGLANTDPEFRDRVLAQLEEHDLSTAESS